MLGAEGNIDQPPVVRIKTSLGSQTLGQIHNIYSIMYSAYSLGAEGNIDQPPFDRIKRSSGSQTLRKMQLVILSFIPFG